VKGDPIAVYLGNLPGVQAVVQARAREIEATAEEIMQPYHYSGATTITMTRNRRRGLFAKGYIVSLIDRASGFEGAIEYGRKPYLVENDPMVSVKGAWTTKKVAPRDYAWVKRFTPLGELYGGMKALKILDRAVKAVQARHRREFRR
jgi:hypothetical protein